MYLTKYETVVQRFIHSVFCPVYSFSECSQELVWYSWYLSGPNLLMRSKRKGCCS